MYRCEGRLVGASERQSAYVPLATRGRWRAREGDASPRKETLEPVSARGGWVSGRRIVEVERERAHDEATTETECPPDVNTRGVTQTPGSVRQMALDEELPASR